MSFNRRLLSVLVLAVVALAISVVSPAPSWAADYSRNQALDQPASLVAPEPDAKITVYLRPEASKSRVGYGANGDAVTVLEQVSDNQSVTWNHIRFDNPPYAEGWVQEEFMLLKGGDAPDQSQRQSQRQQQMTKGNSGDNSGTFLNESHYLGNQRLSAGEAALTQSGQSQFGQSQFGQSPGQQSQFSRQNSRQSYSQRNQN